MTRHVKVAFMAMLLLLLAAYVPSARITSFGQRPTVAQLICCNVMLNVPAWPGYMAGYSTDCKGYIDKASAAVQKDICEQMAEKGIVCPDTAAYCKCQTQAFSINCDCNGDGEDDTSKTFDSCPPGTEPTQYRATRCEGWMSAEGTVQHSGTDTLLSREARAWLEGLSCAALKCHGKYNTCEAQANMQYEKCSTGRRLGVRYENCLASANALRDRCKKDRDKCLDGLRTNGPAPVPQALPTPTPALGEGFVFH